MWCKLWNWHFVLSGLLQWLTTCSPTKTWLSFCLRWAGTCVSPWGSPCSAGPAATRPPTVAQYLWSTKNFPPTSNPNNCLRKVIIPCQGSLLTCDWSDPGSFVLNQPQLPLQWYEDWLSASDWSTPGHFCAEPTRAFSQFWKSRISENVRVLKNMICALFFQQADKILVLDNIM